MISMNNFEYLFDKLWPIYRSLTGEGNRESLKILSNNSRITINEIPSGTKLLDWQVPPEYKVREAWIKDSSGNIIVNFRDNYLHLISYSIPVSGRFTFDELEEHLYTNRELPEAIPYKTFYYQKNWGFCLPQRQLDSLNKNEEYEVLVDSTLDYNGSMSYGERVIKGKSQKEILISTYICHPNMANNELSGPIFTSELQRFIESRDNYYTYRFVYVPETIGAIAILHYHGEYFKENLIAGFVVTCVGDNGRPHFKKSRRGNTFIDRLVLKALEDKFEDYVIEDFFPTGSDERQYCSPYFDLPVVSIMRTRYAKYSEYHTSLDNKSLMSWQSMDHLLQFYLGVLSTIDDIRILELTSGKGEPFLSKYGLDSKVGGSVNVPNKTLLILNILSIVDKFPTINELSDCLNEPVETVEAVCKELVNVNLLRYA